MSDQPRRRRLRFSVRALMLLVLMVAVILGRQVNQARRQRDAVAAIRRYGGWVQYDYEFINDTFIFRRTPLAPKWLRRRLGDEYFQDVYGVDLAYQRAGGTGRWQENPHSSDDVMAHLEAFPRLRVLRVHKGQATDAAMKHVGNLTSLEELTMEDAEVGDTGVACLKGLRNLKNIDISNSRMTDAGLGCLSRLPKVEELGLQGHRFTDAGLSSLSGRTNLKGLYLGLGGAGITDAGMSHLKGLANLETLDLQKTGVTDRGLDQLRGLAKLKEIWTSESRITKDGAARFQAAKPNLKTVR